MNERAHGHVGLKEFHMKTLFQVTWRLMHPTSPQERRRLMVISMAGFMQVLLTIQLQGERWTEVRDFYNITRTTRATDAK